MKKIICFVVILLTMFIGINSIYAMGSISVQDNTIELNKGEEKTFNLIARNVAGRIDITSSDDNVVNVSENNKLWIDSERNGEKTYSITIKGLKEGTAKIVIKPTDLAIYEDDPKLYSGDLVLSIDVKDSMSDNTSNVDNSTNDNVNNPKTGDNIYLYIGLGLLIVVFSIVIIYFIKQKKENK